MFLPPVSLFLFFMAIELFPVPSDFSRKIREIYPELQEITEFSDSKILDEDLRFVILYASPTSPITGTKEERIIQAMDKAYRPGTLTEQKKMNFLLGRFSDEITSAIFRMQKFNPQNRGQAKQAIENVFAQFINILNTNTAKTTITELSADGEAITTNRAMTLDELKKWSEMAIKITGELDSVIEKMERGYGVREKITKENTGRKMIDSVLQEKIELDY